MPMIVTCPCGRQLQLDEQYAGTRVRCPICQQIFQTPGREIGDFQMENAAPPSEPMPVSRHIAAPGGVMPASQPDPSIFGLAPSYPSTSSPARPRTRPLVPHAEVESRPRRSWPVLRMLDVCAALLLLGGGIALVSFLQALGRASATSTDAAGILVGVL